MILSSREAKQRRKKKERFLLQKKTKTNKKQPQRKGNVQRIRSSRAQTHDTRHFTVGKKEQKKRTATFSSASPALPATDARFFFLSLSLSLSFVRESLKVSLGACVCIVSQLRVALYKKIEW